MPSPPHRPGVLAWQVFRGSDAIRQGLVTEHQLRSSAWLRLRHDVYADARLPRDHALACRAAALRLPPEAVVAGPSAAYLHGVEHAASFADDVHVLVPRTMRLGPQRGLRVHSTGPATSPPYAPPPSSVAVRPPGLVDTSIAARAPGLVAVEGPPGRGPADDRSVAVRPSGLVTAEGPPGRGPADDRSVAARPSGLVTAEGPPGRGPADDRSVAARPSGGGLRVADLRTAGPPVGTDPASAAWETAVWLEPLRAVGIVDALLRQGLTSREALAEVADRNADRPGGRRARWVFELADPGARSPAESELRVRLTLAGLPRPAVRHPVRVASGLVVHADLTWPAYRVAVVQEVRHAEAGGGHLDRIARLGGAGWLVLPVTGRRLRHDFPNVLREVRAALGARGWRP
ncbi:hypothetical protein ACGFIG_00990 [Micromonospora sp. NPDC049048]|uniref:hypothetical protein n=1 Tax=Micromonospora sp. NPDC049048 TaxID=3364263 RepID=UPI00371660DE